MTKKQQKIYSASDFQSAIVSTIVDTSWWTIDAVHVTAVGEYSQLPLFEVQLRQVNTGAAQIPVPEGFTDASAELAPNRTYYVREGRPLFNELATIWRATEDKTLVENAVLGDYAGKAFVGHVERVSNVSYKKLAKNNVWVQRSKLELWYPGPSDEPLILGDFVSLCNRGVYIPIVDEQQPASIEEALKGLDIEALKKLLLK